MKFFKPDQYIIYYKGYPKLYIRVKPIFWWLKKWSSFLFILREMTSLAIGFYAIVLILMINAINQGPEAYTEFQTWLKSPISVVLHILALALALYHSFTWFNLAPKAMVIQIGTNKVPGFIISGLNYGAWVALSAILAWFLLN